MKKLRIRDRARSGAKVVSVVKKYSRVAALLRVDAASFPELLRETRGRQSVAITGSRLGPDSLALRMDRSHVLTAVNEGLKLCNLP